MTTSSCARACALLLLVAPLITGASADWRTDPARFDPRQPHLRPFVLPWDDASSGPSDLSHLNHRPAGKFGPIRAGSDGQLYAGGEPIRFLGVNVAFSGAFPTHEEAERIAGRLAKFGVNIVRHHHIEGANYPNGLFDASRGGAPHFHPEAVDRMDYFIAQLKAHGIYSNINLMVLQPFGAAHGLPPEADAVKGKANHLLAFFHDGALAAQQDHARRLLGRVNPYTGFTYAQDPAVAFVEVLNENGLPNYWFAPARRPALEELPPVFREALLARWHDFLRGRHDAGTLAGRWGTAEVDTIRLVPFEGFRDRPLEQRLDWLEFLVALERRYYQSFRALLRDELGVVGLLMGSTAGSSTLHLQAELDVIDGHVYFENPRWRVAPWHWQPGTWSIANATHTGTPAGRLRWLGMFQVAGRPYSVTEFNHAAPGVHAAEAPLYLAAHAALQDWDAIYLYAYAHSNAWSTREMLGLDIDQHPTKMANLMVAAALFRRGDLQPARQANEVWMSPERELEIMATRGTTWNLAHGSHLGLTGDNVMRHRQLVRLDDAPPALAPLPDYALRPTRVLSDTGELYWQRDALDEATRLEINTPRTKAVMGIIGGRTITLGEIRIEVGATLDMGPTLALMLLEGESFAGSPRRALLVATRRFENTGMRWRINPQVPEAPYELETWGRPPGLIESVPARFTVPGDASAMTVFALDERGQRAASIEVSSARPGLAAFAIGPPHHTLWYEVSWAAKVERHDRRSQSVDHSPER